MHVQNIIPEEISQVYTHKVKLTKEKRFFTNYSFNCFFQFVGFVIYCCTISTLHLALRFFYIVLLFERCMTTHAAHIFCWSNIFYDLVVSLARVCWPTRRELEMINSPRIALWSHKSIDQDVRR